MSDSNYRQGDAKSEAFGQDAMLNPAPVEKIPAGPTTPEVAYQMVKDETFAQTQPRLNLATFVTTYMDDYATKLMNEAIDINYIDETEYPRVAVMCQKCINIVANLWNTPEQKTWKTGALAIGSSEACMLGGIAAWKRWIERRKKSRQALRQAKLRNLGRLSGCVGKICHSMEYRNASSPALERASDPRYRPGYQDV